MEKTKIKNTLTTSFKLSVNTASKLQIPTKYPKYNNLFVFMLTLLVNKYLFNRNVKETRDFKCQYNRRIISSVFQRTHRLPRYFQRIRKFFLCDSFGFSDFFQFIPHIQSPLKMESLLYIQYNYFLTKCQAHFPSRAKNTGALRWAPA